MARGEGNSVMAITSLTRFKSDNSEEMVKTARQAKAIVEKHGAEFFRVSRFHTGGDEPVD
jgi:glutamyl-tRNA reductase